MLGEMLLEMDEHLLPVSPVQRGISTAPMSEEMSGAVIRLLECLKGPLDSHMLGRQTVREIVYRVLCSEQGGSLCALASRDEHFTRIARVLKDLHTDCAKPFSVESMARRAKHERCGLPHQLQTRNGQFPASIPLSECDLTGRSGSWLTTGTTPALLRERSATKAHRSSVGNSSGCSA